MADETVYRFILQDEGDSVPTPSPGAAARGSTGPAATGPPVAGGAPAKATPASARASKAEPERFGRPLLDAIARASRISALSAFTSAGANLFRPLLDLGQLVSDLGRRLGSEPRPGRAAAAHQPLPVAKPATPGAQLFGLSRAVFQAQGAQILITGGNVVVAGGSRPIVPGAAAAASRTAPPIALPQPPVKPDRVGGLPAIPPPRRLPALAATRVPVAAGAAARAAAPAIAGATGGAAAGAAGGVAALGATAGAAVLPLAAIVVVAGAAALSLKALHRRATEQSKALAAYDATLAAAQARAQVANIHQDIRSARFLGNDLAEFTKAQSDLKIAWIQRVDKFEKVFLPVATKALEILTVGLDGLNKIDDVIKVLVEISTGTTAIWNANERLVELERKRGDKEENTQAASAFFRLFESFDDLDIDDDEGQLGAPGGPREPIRAPGFGDLPRQLMP